MNLNSNETLNEQIEREKKSCIQNEKKRRKINSMRRESPIHDLWQTNENERKIF